jgi:hypothetical protein
MRQLKEIEIKVKLVQREIKANKICRRSSISVNSHNAGERAMFTGANNVMTELNSSAFLFARF